MEILSFKITGKFAHFRKYFANNTAFSFSIPPRTTLMGIVASVMGLPKDQYYEDFAADKLRFGVRVLTPIKKSFHRVNFLSIKSTGDLAKKFSSDFRGEGGRIQTPFEIVSAWEIGKKDISYQIFLSCHSTGKEVFEKICSHFLDKEPVYNISLGTANFSASISNITLIKGQDIKTLNSRDFILFHSAIPSKDIKELKFDKDEFDNYNFVEEDLLPGDFIGNRNREVKTMNRLLFSISQNPLRVTYLSEFFQVKYQEDFLNIQFMES